MFFRKRKIPEIKHRCDFVRIHEPVLCTPETATLSQRAAAAIDELNRNRCRSNPRNYELVHIITNAAVKEADVNAHRFLELLDFRPTTMN